LGRGIRPRSARYPHFTERTCPRHLRTGSSQYLIRAVAGDRVGAVEPAAYESYLRGRSFWNQRTPAGLNQAIGHFQRAIELDPGYAEAYSGLADAYTALGYTSFSSPRDAFPRARELANKALGIDPSLAEARASLAYARLYY